MQYGCLIPTIYPTGVFIQSIEQTKTSDESGGENVFTATLTNHTQQQFVVKNGHTGSACEGINEIRASVDNSVGTPSVEVVETDAGTKKDINFIFKNLKGEVGDTKAKMPLNPVISYDMADACYNKRLLYTIPTPIINKKEATIISNVIVYTKNQAETYYHVHLESSSTGNAQPALILYRQDWAPQTYIIWEYCNGVQDFFVSIPQQNFDFGIGIWMHGDGSYQVQPNDSVSVYKFTVNNRKTAY